MAERVALLGRTWLKSSVTTTSSANELFSSIFLNQTNFTTTTSKQQQEKETNKLKGRWFTLPSYTFGIDPSSVVKRLSERPQSDPPTTTTTTTAVKWVLRCCPQIPKSLIQKLFRLKQVRREPSESPSASGLETEAPKRRSKWVSAKDELNVGDRIFLPITVQELSLVKPKEKVKQERHYSPEEIRYFRSLELHKDQAIIVVNKPPGMPVQGGIGIKNSLDDLAVSYLKYDYPEPPRLVHRLDRDSSGILVLGRTQTSATILHSLFREKTFSASNSDTDASKRLFQKRYWALVIGTPKRRKGFISAPLGKVVMDNGKSERITIVDDDQSIPYQHAVTEYTVIDTPRHGYTWLELCPVTGRKHQLRVHCAEVLGTPIVGDYKYGWQAHKKWEPLLSSEPEGEKVTRSKFVPFGLDLESGSILEKQPHLHLHCRKMTLPNVSLALRYIESGKDWDISELQSLELAAPLPLHMQRSWDILKS